MSGGSSQKLSQPGTSGNKSQSEWGRLLFPSIILLAVVLVYFFGQRSSNNMLDHVPSPLAASQNKSVDTTPVPVNLTHAEVKKTLGSLVRVTDKIAGLTYYKPDSRPEYPASKLGVILGELPAPQKYALLMKIMYKGDDWLFINEIKFLVDGQRFAIDLNSFDIKRDNDGDGVWEWVVLEVTAERYLQLIAIANSKSTEMRYVGRQSYIDRRLSRNEKQAIAKMLNAYEKLGGLKSLSEN